MMMEITEVFHKLEMQQLEDSDSLTVGEVIDILSSLPRETRMTLEYLDNDPDMCRYGGLQLLDFSMPHDDELRITIESIDYIEDDD